MSVSRRWVALLVAHGVLAASVVGWALFSPQADPMGCWVEANSSQPSGVEPICGPLRLRLAPYVVTRYEDGSRVWSDGSSSCLPGYPCDDSMRGER